MFRSHGFYRPTMRYGDEVGYNPATGFRQNQGVSYGAAAPAARPAPAPVRLSNQAAGIINTAVKPVRWALYEAGAFAKWVGGTLQNVGTKL